MLAYRKRHPRWLPPRKVTVRMLRRLLVSCGVFVSLGWWQPAYAGTLFGVVAEHAASEAAAGAEQFLARHPNHTLILRTPSQIAALTDQELTTHWQRADAVLIASIYGDAVPRLTQLLRDAPPPPTAQVAVVYEGSGEAQLAQLSRFAEGDATALAQASAYWQGRGSDNIAHLFAFLLQHTDSRLAHLPAPRPEPPVRYYHDGHIVPQEELTFDAHKPLVVLFDHHTGDRAGNRDLLNALSEAFRKQGVATIGILAKWGAPSAQELRTLAATVAPAKVRAIISLQDFVIGGGEYREEVTRSLAALNVPVFKGIRLNDRTEAEWRIAEDGLPWDSVHYRVAMPELQGVSQPMVVACATPPSLHRLTGLKISVPHPITEQVTALVERATRWIALQEKPNADKRVALVYYNHPPGRHNIGADNLDVPQSLWGILHALRDHGYTTGALPASPEALLDLMQERGVNLPDQQDALQQAARQGITLDALKYQQWFHTLPLPVQLEMREGPLGYVHGVLQNAVHAHAPRLGERVLARVTGDVQHLLEGIEHPQKARALDLFRQLKDTYEQIFTGRGEWPQAERLIAALRATGIEGLRGWGEPPGEVMTFAGDLLIPGLEFGNVFIGPQPPRGWELDEELLHANTAIPPTHQYLAFYYWIHQELHADAVIHLGRHSTYEFLPRKRVGLTTDDYPTIIAGALPDIYPYIVDGVGEGIQAKRRGVAVIIDHLTPPLQTTPLYDDLLELRQLVESFETAEAGQNSPAQLRAVTAMRGKIEELHLREELEHSMAKELRVRGVEFDQIDDALLVHEIGHYLTKLQESFMPFGLHIFGQDWDTPAIDMMLKSMSGEAPAPPAWRRALTRSPQAEMTALLAALNGEFVLPGKGNDPIRTPEALPTGRNFHALDGGVLPTRVAYELGIELARAARADHAVDDDGNEAVVLWASDTVRDEGVMVAFGMDMLGIKPVWNSRGLLTGLERLPLEDERVRRDTVFTTSGLFRDLYANLLVWLDRAVLLALDGASETIRREHPALIPALEAALARLGEFRLASTAGSETLQDNQVAAHWVATARELLAQGIQLEEAGTLASLRLFGDAPGAYGAGINRLVERSGAWTDRREIAQTYLRRLGHAYGSGLDGIPAHASFTSHLRRVKHTYLGRASNLYGLLDNNDAFDYLGGLSMAVETLTGAVPLNRVIQHADPQHPTMEFLDTALLKELRGQHLNPHWLAPLMQHGYAGARTMGSEFLEYLWGWQVTNPDIIHSWVWDEVKRVYIDDGLELGLDEFLEEGHNVHVKTNMLAILLVAAHKGYWEADPATLEAVATQFAELIVEHGLPGSGHTRPDHPLFAWLAPHIAVELRAQLAQVLARAQRPAQEAVPLPPTIAEINIAEEHETSSAPAADSATVDTPASDTLTQTPLWAIGALLPLLLVGGFLHGRRGGMPNVRKLQR